MRPYNRSHKWQCAVPRKYGTQQQGGSHKAGELKRLVYETGSSVCETIFNRAAVSRPKGSAAMSVLDLLRKGFGFLLLSMGVSRPAPKPGTKPAPKPGHDA